MSEIISSKDIQPVVIQVASAEDAATLARIETGIRTAAQNVVQGYLTIGSYLNELKKQELQTNHIVCHTFHSLYTDAVDYYIYALRRIII